MSRMIINDVMSPQDYNFLALQALRCRPRATAYADLLAKLQAARRIFKASEWVEFKFKMAKLSQARLGGNAGEVPDPQAQTPKQGGT